MIEYFKEKGLYNHKELLIDDILHQAGDNLKEAGYIAGHPGEGQRGDIHRGAGVQPGVDRTGAANLCAVLRGVYSEVLRNIHGGLQLRAAGGISPGVLSLYVHAGE